MTPLVSPQGPSGEYRKWLHLFVMRGDSIAATLDYVDGCMSYPWIWQEDEPDFEALTAMWIMTAYTNLPDSWASFWFDLRAQKRNVMIDAGSWRSRLHGPYWMMTPRMQMASVAQVLVGRKRRLVSQEFKRGYVNTPATKDFVELVYADMAQYRVCNLIGDEFDETERADEIRRRIVQERDCCPPNRPPGCRQV